MECLGFEPRPQDGKRRRNHGAMAATYFFIIMAAQCSLFSVLSIFVKPDSDLTEKISKEIEESIE